MKTLITIIRSVVARVGVAGRNFLSVQFIKTNLNLLQTRIFCAVALGIGSFFGLAAATEDSADTASATTAIPWSQLGAKAGAEYLFSGVRPSSGAASSACPTRWNFPETPLALEAAAPEDGRTPLNTYGADYQGDALAAIPTAEGAWLRCVFQRLEGEATREGLWWVTALAVSGSDLYAGVGGLFTSAGGPAISICQMGREQLVGAGSAR